MIDFNEIKPYIYNYLRDEYKIKDPHKPFYCPICGKGHRTPCASVDPRTYRIKCFSCGWSGDILNLLEATKGLKPVEAAQYIGERYNSTSKKKLLEIESSSKERASELDYSGYYQACEQRLTETNYLARRGIETTVAKRFKLGFDPNWRHPAAPTTIPTTPRLIIPTSCNSYLARDTREQLSPQDEKYKKMRVGQMIPFNAVALEIQTTQPVFIVEGELNAISLESVGFPAVGIGSAANANSFLTYISEHVPARPLIIMLDNDEAGISGQKVISNGLAELGFSFMSAEYPFSGEDINDTLCRDKENLKVRMEKIYNQYFSNNTTSEKPLLIKKNLVSTTFDQFLSKITDPNFKPIPTGFKGLDDKLGGGLYSGLVIIAASPSEGKSALAMQLCETIAENQSRDVLVFPFEMSTEQLLARAISRLSYEAEKSTDHAVTALEVLRGKEWDKLDPSKRKNIDTAINRYRERIAPYIYIFDDCDANTASIMQKIALYDAERPVDRPAPVVLVDYLQLLDSGDKEFVAGCKDITLALKRYAIENDTVVIAVSSVNREGQKYGANMTSLYGSSFAEYGCDTLLTMDFTDIKRGTGIADKDYLKRQPIREMTITIQKNRMGLTGEMIDFQYLAAYNYFSDTPTEAQIAMDIKRRDHSEGNSKGVRTY